MAEEVGFGASTAPKLSAVAAASATLRILAFALQVSKRSPGLGDRALLPLSCDHPAKEVDGNS
jgi:hypothetical protein